eukprot:TRINITY_DN67355_c2_g1_i6.p1 TRINITY_DN67355_c2_g1~~TRINITY_DN67355_c2_g1_i6.p1  ORF type:complete len:370 (-),score=16.40 TRINITY_DN67355_c2_g1_i6:300-1409(-)
MNLPHDDKGLLGYSIASTHGCRSDVHDALLSLRSLLQAWVSTHSQLPPFQRVKICKCGISSSSRRGGHPGDFCNRQPPCDSATVWGVEGVSVHEDVYTHQYGVSWKRMNVVWRQGFLQSLVVHALTDHHTAFHEKYQGRFPLGVDVDIIDGRLWAVHPTTTTHNTEWSSLTAFIHNIQRAVRATFKAKDYSLVVLHANGGRNQHDHKRSFHFRWPGVIIENKTLSLFHKKVLVWYLHPQEYEAIDVTQIPPEHKTLRMPLQNKVAKELVPGKKKPVFHALTGRITELWGIFDGTGAAVTDAHPIGHNYNNPNHLTDFMTACSMQISQSTPITKWRTKGLLGQLSFSEQTSKTKKRKKKRAESTSPTCTD